nr:aminoacyl-tRNA hydrolase [Corynebacterium lubricantis]
MFNFLRRIFGSSPTTLPGSPLEGVAAEWLIVGLGNPGAKYETTRHNVGYMATDLLLSKRGLRLEPVPGRKALAAVGDGLAFARSTTYMNVSGEGIAPIAAQLGISPDHIIVLHDELDLPPGEVRVKLGGNENGHNGLKSLTEHLGTRDYNRVRIGIGRPNANQSIPEWVLGQADSGPEFEDQITRAGEAAALIAAEGLAKAQNQVNSRRRK